MPVVRRQSYSISDVVLGGQTPISIDYINMVYDASILVDIVSGNAIYTVEFTMDDITGITSANGTVDVGTLRWHELPDFAAPQTATKFGRLDLPVTAIRLNIGSMTGELRMSVIQGNV